MKTSSLTAKLASCIAGTTHTPGPWRLSPGEASESVLFPGYAEQGKIIIKGDNRIANACLVSAAPELLHSLAWAIQFAEKFAADHNDGVTMASCIAQAKSAIRKAIGWESTAEPLRLGNLDWSNRNEAQP